MSAAAPQAEAVIDRPVLSVRGATKRFGSVLALDGVDLEVRRGEILALLGDNGAGKSTLIKCISGLHHLDSGSIHLDGLETAIRSPADARFAGIETVYQDLALFDNLTPAQNFFAGREIAGPAWLPRGLRFLKKRSMDAEARQVISRLKVTLPKLDVVVAKMSGGQRQAIAVARSTVFARKVVILDEPTAALGLQGVAAGTQSGLDAPRSRQRGDPDHPQHGTRRRTRRPRHGAAAGQKGRRTHTEQQQQAGSGRDDRRSLSLKALRTPSRPQSGRTASTGGRASNKGGGNEAET